MFKPEAEVHNIVHQVCGEIGKTLASPAETFCNQVMLALMQTQLVLVKKQQTDHERLGCLVQQQLDTRHLVPNLQKEQQDRQDKPVSIDCKQESGEF